MNQRWVLSTIWMFSSWMALAQPAAAIVETCSADLLQDPVRRRAIEFLRSVSGSYELGTCRIELHVCSEESFDESNRGTSLVGDLLIVDRFGVESYIQLDFGRGSGDRTRIQIQNGRIMFHYEFDDRHWDPVAGRTESIRLEMLKTPDLQRLRSLHAGVYSTNEWLGRNRRYTYHWSICEEEAVR